MPYDQVRVLKIECPAEGGTQTDFAPTELNPFQDAPVVPAIYVQNTAGTTLDRAAFVDRNSADLRLTDANAGTKNAQDLVTRVLGGVASHASLLDIVHFLDEGPGDGWGSGANLRVTRTGPLLATKTWYTSTANTAVPIIQVAYTYLTGTPLLGTKTWKLYNAAGVVVRTLTDTITYSGVLVASVTRAWS
jgi:hypothetical protein